MSLPVTRLRRLPEWLVFETMATLAPHPQSLIHHLDHWASRAPDRLFLAERDGSGWRTVTYQQAQLAVQAIGAGLIGWGCEFGDRIALLDQNSVRHALLALATMAIGCVAVPINAAYLASEMGRGRLKAIAGVASPRLCYFGPSSLPHLQDGVPSGLGLALLPDRLQAWVTSTPSESDAQRVAQRTARLTHETLAKILFTSGSTGQPKGVPHTNGMLCAQQQQMAQLWPSVAKEGLVLCDWLPWTHTSGGNHSFNMTLRNGGTLYIDDGRPTVQGIARTADNLRLVSPRWYTNVPLGYAMLLPHLESDHDLARRFFGHLELMVYGGAAISADLWSRLNTLCRTVRGADAPWVSGWGCTETTSTICITPEPVKAAGCIGIPLPGMQLRLRPHAGHFHAFARGPNVAARYVNPADADRNFDSQGFFDTGDLVAFVDSQRPDLGLRYVGRLAETFKLASGIWIVPGTIKSRLLQLSGAVVTDAVIVGANRDRLYALLWLHEDVALQEFGSPAASLSFGEPGPLRAHLDDVLSRFNAEGASTSQRLQGLGVLTVPPQATRGELTEKGSINARSLQLSRADAIETMYARQMSGVFLFDRTSPSES